MKIIDRIISFKQDYKLFKHQQIVRGINVCIEKGELKIGDKLPSLNVMAKELGYSTATILKGYRELQESRLIDSVKNKGYFVANRSLINE